jgi:transketolase
MLNHSLKLNTKIFNPDVEKKPIRDGIGLGLLNAGLQNENIYVLSADLKDPTRVNIFADKFPERFIQVGISEQNLASVASGIASMGKIPFISSFAIFSPGRNWEQIRTNICYNNQPVKIIGTHAGVTVGEDGGSHQALEDIALMRVLPNMVVLSPCDYIEARKAIVACSKTDEPTYIRSPRHETPLITTEDTPFEIGKANLMFVPDIGLATVGIIATSHMVYNAIISAKRLEEEGIKVKVLNLSTIKPFDEKAVLDLARETKAIVTVEEHQISGGMGSAISEFLSQNYSVPIGMIGVNDRFGQSGTAGELMKEYGLEVSDIIDKVKKLIKQKGTY